MKTKLYVATHNAHKIREIGQILPGFEIIPDDPAGVEENAPDFTGNALVKVRAIAARHEGAWCLADDSGLEVRALDGAPGVRSARYAGEPSDTAANNALLLKNLAGVEDRRANFTCAVALVDPDGNERLAVGRCFGRIAEAPRGADGFGYDPLFVPDGHEKSFAELSAEEKNAISHRGRALEEVKAIILDEDAMVASAERRHPLGERSEGTTGEWSEGTTGEGPEGGHAAPRRDQSETLGQPSNLTFGNVFELLDERLRRAVREAGYEKPTPIQEQAIPPVLEGRDLIGCAQTGTGKTAAFLLPILHRLAQTKEQAKFRAGHPRALVLSPTRELAAQTCENHVKYAKYTRTHYACVFGGVSQFYQVKDVQRGAEIVIATPGRLIDLMTQGVVFLDAVEHVVLDEADRMLDMGFLPDVKRILGKLPVKKQALFFSATLSPQIMKLAGELVRDPVQVMITPEKPAVEKINQKLMCVEKGNKDNLLVRLLESHPEWKKVIVFAKMRHGADRVCKKLMKNKVACAAIHSDKTQNQRTRALQNFKSGAVRVLVATDIASRGIDVPEVDLVVQMELPLETESYVHRIGRTARAGAGGAAISFVSPEERNLVRAVERFIRQTIPVDRDQPFHCEAAELKGSKGRGLPTAPWIKGGRRNGPFNKAGGAKFARKPKGAGRRQPDFGQKRES